MRYWTFLLQRFVRRYVHPIAYRRPPQSGLTPDRLYAWLDTVHRRRHLDGDIVEVGCDECGTSYLTLQFLKRTGDSDRRYICIDTFQGFVPAQFEHDARHHGVQKTFRRTFANSTIDYVRGLLRKYNAAEIELVQGDIVNMPDDTLPKTIAVSLLDVDLEIPIYEGLKRIYPRLVTGGAILIDDCEEGNMWGARKGWLRFVEENGLSQKQFMGMGLVEKT